MGTVICSFFCFVSREYSYVLASTISL